MKRFVPSLLGILLMFFVFSCQREVSLELGQPSSGSLQSETTGDCLAKTVAGAYVAGSTLTDSNYMLVEVNVGATGPYTISTDTINGYFFRATGVFGQTGINRVKLKSSGKPMAAGTDEFMVFYDSSYCYVPVTVLPAGSNTGPAQLTLQSSANTCSNISLDGDFVKGVVLTGATKANVEVNVSTVGTYTISTNTVNGIRFSGTGTFGSTGVQTVSLTASGTPVNNGVQVFTITAGSSSCNFSVTVSDASTTTPGTSNDHFPLNLNSWWSYDSEEFLGDTVKRVVTGTKQFGGNTYKEIEAIDEDGSAGFTYIRKSGNDYRMYCRGDFYSLVTFDEEKLTEILFLKENLTKGVTWNSPVYTGKFQGQTINIKYIFKCEDNNASVTIDGNVFTNVYKISITSQISMMGAPYTTDVVTEEHYAKGVGKIYQKKTYLNADGLEMNIRYWKVN